MEIRMFDLCSKGIGFSRAAQSECKGPAQIDLHIFKIVCVLGYGTILDFPPRAPYHYLYIRWRSAFLYVFVSTLSAAAARYFFAGCALLPKGSVGGINNMTKKIKKFPPDRESIARIRFLVLDVDGVLTNGLLLYSSAGEEMKAYDVKDGTGIKYWNRAGHRAGIVSGGSGKSVLRYAEDHGILQVSLNAKQKLPVFHAMLAEAGVTPEETAMIGDDLPDYPLILQAGFGVAVADAVDEVKEAADYITEKKGGRGAVRETIEYILRIQGRWDGILKRYLASDGLPGSREIDSGKVDTAADDF